MKKLIFLLAMIVSFGAYAQKDSIKMNDHVFQASNRHSLCYSFYEANFHGSTKDALMWQHDYVDNQSKVCVYWYSLQYGGFSVFPKTTLMIPGYLSGVAVLKTLDTVNSIQTIYADTLATYRNDSIGLRFTTFKKCLGYTPTMIRTGEVKNQLAGDETLLVDTSFKKILVYHFNGLTCDSLQTINVGDSITCLEFGDFNGDGWNDLVVVCKTANSNSKAKIYTQNTSELVFWREISLNRVVCSARVKDLHLDGFPDLIISSVDSLTAGLTIVNFTNPASMQTFDNYDGYKIGDFTVDGDLNNDGYFDIAALRNDTSLMVIFRNDQNGHFICDGLFPSGTTQPLIYHSVIIVNLGSDNKSDIGCSSGSSFWGNNNCTPNYADLKISNIDLSSVLHTGNNFNDTVKVKINNIGEAVANCDSLLSIKLLLTLKSAAGNTLSEKILYQSFDSISKGDSITFYFLLDSISVPSGAKLEARAIVDSIGYLSELTIKNNSVTKTFNSIGLPDLIIHDMYFMDYSLSKAGIMVENQGDCQVSNFKLKVFVIQKDGDSIIYLRNYDTVFSNLDSQCFNFFYINNINIESLADSIIIIAFVDYDSTVVELNEDNNVRVLRAKARHNGLEDVESFYFSAYPNPTSGLINLVIPKAGETVEIFNNLGQKIWFKEKVSQQEQIDLSNYPSGVYYLKINNLSKKIIKK